MSIILPNSTYFWIAGKVALLAKPLQFIFPQKIKTMIKLMPASLIQEAVNMEVAIKDGTLHPFTGPIYNQAGELVIPEGQVADDGMLAGMSFYVQGIDGDIPQ